MSVRVAPMPGVILSSRPEATTPLLVISTGGRRACPVRLRSGQALSEVEWAGAERSGRERGVPMFAPGSHRPGLSRFGRETGVHTQPRTMRGEISRLRFAALEMTEGRRRWAPKKMDFAGRAQNRCKYRRCRDLQARARENPFSSAYPPCSGLGTRNDRGRDAAREMDSTCSSRPSGLRSGYEAGGRSGLTDGHGR
jgi:hypothetical protein